MANNAEEQQLPRPLYRLAGDVRKINLSCGHAGLWYDKFCDHWQSGWALPAQQKAAWINRVVSGGRGGDVKVRADHAGLIEEHVNRRKTLVEKCLNGVCLQLYSESRFVTGLGQEHPVENGFAWHPALGVPYLPGSGIKGLLRAWARDWEDDQERRSKIDAILGAGERGNGDSGQVGAVIIFDALPVQPVRLEADVMTPHYDEYYQRKQTPGDWISPVPIPFPVVAAGTPFLFSFAPRTPAAKAYLPIVETWLRDALQWLGAGAKTSVGYGRFGETSPETMPSSSEDGTKVTASPSGSQKSIELPKPQTIVEAVLLSEKTKKGGWKAEHKATGISGPVQNSSEVPSDKQAGDTVTLVVKYANLKQIAFCYPTGEAKQEPARSQSNSSGQKKRRRRR